MFLIKRTMKSVFQPRQRGEVFMQGRTEGREKEARGSAESKRLFGERD